MSKHPKKALTAEQKAAKARKRLENYNPVMAARNALRREFSRSPVVIELMKDPATTRLIPLYNKDGKRSKVDGREHLCNLCKLWKRGSKGKKASIDHVEPVVHPDVGFVDMNTYFARMWVPKDQLQKLCGDCHQKKTNSEWFERRFKEEQALLERALTVNRIEAKKLLQRFTKKKWECGQYPVDFMNAVESLKATLKGGR